MTTDWTGTYTALVTPFTSEGDIDEARLRDLVDFQVAGKVEGIVPCGTTGESATMTPDERLRVIEVVYEQAAGRAAVLAGAGGNATHEVAGFARRVAAVGVDGILSVVPYYNKPTPDGLHRHFSTIADAVDVPVVLYNVPGRTSTNMRPETVLRLAEHERIVGVKEASGSLAQTMEIVAHAPDGFRVLSGEDDLTLAIVAVGGDGVISVVANEIPDVMSDMVRAARAGAFDTARALHYKALPLMQANFIESNPIPVKAALAMMGRVGEHYRLPLAPLSATHRAPLRAILAELGLVESS